MSRSVDSVINATIDAQGWTGDVLVDLLRDYIESNGLSEDLADYLHDVALKENWEDPQPDLFGGKEG